MEIAAFVVGLVGLVLAAVQAYYGKKQVDSIRRGEDPKSLVPQNDDPERTTKIVTGASDAKVESKIVQPTQAEVRVYGKPLYQEIVEVYRSVVPHVLILTLLNFLVLAASAVMNILFSGYLERVIRWISIIFK